jgi:hypothetical protein
MLYAAFFRPQVVRGLIDIHRIVQGRSESERAAQLPVRHSKTRHIRYWL